jgi:hypothetical protein
MFVANVPLTLFRGSAIIENGILLQFEHNFNDMTMWHRRKWQHFVT